MTSRWSFIQGESVLHHSLTDNLKSSSSSGMKRRMQKKTTTLKQKQDDLVNATAAAMSLQAENALMHAVSRILFFGKLFWF